MPCYSPPMHRNEFGEYQEGEIPQETFDKLVRLLCEANRIIDSVGNATGQGQRSPELEDWWVKHKAWDKLRGSRRRRK